MTPCLCGSLARSLVNEKGSLLLFKFLTGNPGYNTRSHTPPSSDQLRFHYGLPKDYLGLSFAGAGLGRVVCTMTRGPAKVSLDCHQLKQAMSVRLIWGSVPAGRGSALELCIETQSLRECRVYTEDRFASMESWEWASREQALRLFVVMFKICSLQMFFKSGWWQCMVSKSHCTP